MKKLTMSLITVLSFLLSMTACKKDDTSTDCINESAIDMNMACYELYTPVCGCDNKTYANDCYAEAAGVQSWVEGECE